MSVFFDTNLVIYSLDDDAPQKQALVVDLMLRLMREQTQIVISTQVLIETANACRKLGFDDVKVGNVLATLRTFRCDSTSRETVENAWLLKLEHKISWFDALIVQAAIDADCDVLYSEDLQHGRKFGELEVVNPLLN
jgi:predicted nucleic acid-binding protein